MIQNSARRSGQLLEVERSQDNEASCLSYSMLADEVEKEELLKQLQQKGIEVRSENPSCSNQGSEKAYKGDFLEVAGNEQFWERSNRHKNMVHIFRSNEVDTLIKEQGLGQEVAQGKLLGVRLGVGKEGERKEGVEQPEKRLGDNILVSKMMIGSNKSRADLGNIEEESQIVDRERSGSDGSSHFLIAQDSNSFNIFSQFQQPPPSDLNLEFKVIICGNQKPSPSDLPPNTFTLKQTESQIKESSKALRSEDKKNTDSFSFRQVSKNQSSGKDKEPFVGLKEEEKHFQDRMFESKLVVRKDELELKEGDIKNNRSTEQSKKPLVQVGSRMKSTYDPKKQEPEFNSATNGYLSERDNRSAQNQPQDHPKFIDPILDPSIISQQKKTHQPNQLNHQLGEQIITKLNNLEKIVDSLKEASSHDQSEEKSKTSQLKEKEKGAALNARQSMKMSHKIETLKNLAPEQFREQLFNGFSSIDSDKKQQKAVIKKRVSYKDNNDSNIQVMPRDSQATNQHDVYTQLQLLTEKVIRLEKAVSKKQSSNLLDSAEDRQFKIKYKNYQSYNSRTKLLARSKSEKKMDYSGFGNNLISSGDIFDFEETVPDLLDQPTPHSSQQELAEMGINILEQFKIKPKGSLHMFHFKDRVQFHVLADKESDNIFIVWQFNGLFYLGGGVIVYEKVVRQGRAVEILPGSYIYKGLFQQDKKSGEGAIIQANGTKYKGEWRNNLYEGNGKLSNKRSMYKGTFHLGQRHGKGRQMYSNDDIYEGDYACDKYNGVGRYMWKDGMVYVGDFKNGFMQGHGLWRSSKGDSYQGQFMKNLKHGFGKYRWKTGEVFEGQFVKGQKVKSNRGIIMPQSEIPYDESLSWDSFERWGLTRRSISPTTTIKKRFTIEKQDENRFKSRNIKI